MPRVPVFFRLPVLVLTALAACDGAAPAGPGSEMEFKPGAPSRLSNQIEIRLDMQPNDAADVGFSVTGVKPSTFILDDDADLTRSNIRVIPTPQPGSYTVAIGTLPANWNLVALYCTSFPNGGTGSNNNVFNIPLGTVTILLEPSERTSCTFVVAETVQPTVTIEQAASQADPTASYAVSFDVVFSDAVTEFVAADVVLGGTAPATVTSVTSVTPTEWTVVATATGSGTVTADIPADAVTGSFSGPFAASTSTDNTVTIDDDVAPTAYIEQVDQSSCLGTAVNVTFSEPVTGLTAGDISLDGAFGTGFVSGSGANYTVDFGYDLNSGPYSVAIPAGAVTDQSGNANTESAQGIEVVFDICVEIGES